MLVVSRKTNQSIMIGDNIEVVMLESHDGIVKIGINAPRDIKVYRKEIFDEIRDENNRALVIDMNAVKKILDNE
jgi:carbon storage regulator